MNLKSFVELPKKARTGLRGLCTRQLETPSGADASRARRAGGVRWLAVVPDIEEVRRVARMKRALPPTATNLQTSVD